MKRVEACLELPAKIAVAEREERRVRVVEEVLPVDHVVAANPDDGANARNVSVEDTPADRMGLDIGEATQRIYGEIISSAQTIIWNGPMTLTA